MQPLTTIAGGFCAAALLATAAAAAQPIHDPMAALQTAAPLDALHSIPPPSSEKATAPAVPDPMAAAGESQAGTAMQQTAAVQGAPNPELGNLPDGPGAEETFYQCVACHSTAIIRQQRVTDARWDYLWNWMVEAQGMVEPDDKTKDVILGYLKQHFSSGR